VSSMSEAVARRLLSGPVKREYALIFRRSRRFCCPWQGTLAALYAKSTPCQNEFLSCPHEATSTFGGGLSNLSPKRVSEPERPEIGVQSP
jgi:hypothetical protein